MESEQATVATITSRLNETYFLPGIQRQFVWSKSSIERLFDSVLRGYPIGKLTAWRQEKRDGKYAEDYIYDFVTNFVSDEVNPFQEQESGEHSDWVHTTGQASPDASEINLVIDGQQRLTSLYIGLRGSYIDYKSNHSRMNEDSWREYNLYLNLFGTKAHSPGDCRYEFKFLTETQASRVAEDELWFQVGDVLDIPAQMDSDMNEWRDFKAYYEDFLQDDVMGELDGIDAGEYVELERRAADNLKKLYDALTDEYTIEIDIQKSRDRERIQRIFFRLNEEGKTVSPVEKLLSHAMIHWAYADDGAYNPREGMFEYIKDINEENETDGKTHFSIDLNFLFQTLSLLGLRKARPDNSLSTDEMETLKHLWVSGGAQDSIREVLRFLREIGLSKQGGLRANNMLIPVIYYYHHAPRPDLRDDENVERIVRYFVMGTLGGVAANNADQWVEAAITAIEETNTTYFPYDEISDRIAEATTRILEPDRRKLTDKELPALRYPKSDVRLVLAFLRAPDLSPNVGYEVDHIFCRQLFTEATYDHLNLSESEREMYEEYKDSIWNLQLLKEVTHEMKTEEYDKQEGLEAPQNWIHRTNNPEWDDEKTQDYLETHKIPADDEVSGSLYDFGHFLEFIDARKSRLLREFGVTEDDATSV